MVPSGYGPEKFLMDWIPFDPRKDENPFGPDTPVKEPVKKPVKKPGMSRRSF